MLKRRAALAVVLALALPALLFAAGELLSAPSQRPIGPPPPTLAAEAVVIEMPAQQNVAGWFARGTPGRGAVLLLHGVRSDRRQMVERAKFLHAAGYSVLLIDLPAHGESTGSRISFGLREADGVKAAIAFLRRTLPGERTAVIGVSLGAASFVLASDAPPPDAVVLESMYPTITDAVANRLRMRIGPLGAQLAPLLLWQLPVRLGIGADQLRPIDHLAALHAPLLIAGGRLDEQTPVAETQRLFAAAAEPKQLWLVDGAAHVDLHAFTPAAYEARVLAFLHRHLRSD